MGGRVVYGTGLENRRARKGTVSSNLTPSASLVASSVCTDSLETLWPRKSPKQFAAMRKEFATSATMPCRVNGTGG